MKPLFLLIAVLSLPTWAQNCAQIDEKLTTHYQKMQNAGSYSDHFDDEVLEFCRENGLDFNTEHCMIIAPLSIVEEFLKR